ncbi:MAG: nucleotidyltransferase domain-containing protein [Candidatus Aminicenantes bacterium]|nr:nucleotidyltransferase domain-containing protein [Candidatus Aminicenantes bacterium]
MIKTYSLCTEVLKRFRDSGILENIIVVGSWCIYFYKDYFQEMEYKSLLRTRDIDFLVPIPPVFKKKVDVHELLKDLGFLLDFHIKGYIRLVHPELIIEFLVPERGKGFDKPFPLPHLGVNAQSLRFLDFLEKNSMKIESDHFLLNVPHPAAFALHKLMISERRLKEGKRIKERRDAVHILNCLIEKGEKEIKKRFFESIPKRWKTKVVNTLRIAEEERFNDFLK